MTWQWLLLILGLAVCFTTGGCVMAHLGNVSDKAKLDDSFRRAKLDADVKEVEARYASHR